MEQNQPTSLFEMQADGATHTHLGSISKWGKFIAITWLVFAGLFLLAAASKGQEILDQLKTILAFDNKLAGVLIAVLVVVGLLCLLWLFFLLRACILIRQALTTNDSDQLANGFRAFKNFFIISIIFSILSILTSITSMINS